MTPLNVALLVMLILSWCLQIALHEVNKRRYRRPELTRVENGWYTDVDVPIDGYHFHKCRFDRCTLVSGPGDSRLTSCVFGEGTTLLTSNAQEKGHEPTAQ